MKNKKCILVFTLIIAFLFVMVTFAQATSENPLTIVSNNEANNATTNNEQTNTANNEAGNNTNTAPLLTNNTSNNTTTNTNQSGNTLPKTGITENTTLFVFIAVCVVSAGYAFTKIRNYK